MVIKINYTSSDVYVSTSVSPVYVVVNYSSVNNGGGAIWGGITGTISDQTDLQDALDDKVPYTGATANVDLGGFSIKPSMVQITGINSGGTGGVLNIKKGNTRVIGGDDAANNLSLWAETGAFGFNDWTAGNTRDAKFSLLSITNNATRTYTLPNLDGTLALLSDITPGLTSVGLSMPSAFTVSNSPLTSNGTIAVTGAGTSSQYIRGDGQLANFPTNGGGGSSVNYYLNGSVTQGTFGGDTYYEMSKTPVLGAGTDFTRTNAQGNGYIASFITDAGDPSLLNIPGGNWNLEFYFNASSSGSTPQFYGEIYKVDASNNFTLIASASANPETISSGTIVDQYFTSIPVPQTSLLSTDRLAVRIYVIPSGRTITLHTENSNLCEVLTTLSTGLNALNGLTSQVQYFATGTSGTDFAISSVTDTHTFNLPTASATNRGALSSADWSTFSGKVGGSGATGQVAYWNGTNSQTGSNNLFWDAANARLGIGTTSPQVNLSVVSSGNNYGLFIGPNAGNTTGKRLKIGYFATANYAVIQSAEDGVNIRNLILQPDGGNLLVGTTTDGGQRLQVQGDAFIKGSGATSATNGFTIQNSASTELVRVDNSGQAFFSNRIAVNRIQVTSTANQLELVGGIGGATGGTGIQLGQFTNATNTSGTFDRVLAAGSFLPTSGTGLFNGIQISATINQTGGANGITRGLYVNPTLNAAADWRSIEWSNNSGWGLYGAGTAKNYLGGELLINTLSSVAGYQVAVGGGIYSSGNIRFDTAIRDNRDNSIITQSISSVTVNRILTIGNGTYLNINFPNGNLLVGTTTDAGFKLDVNGTARVSGNVTSGGTVSISRGLNSYVANLAISSGVTPVSAFQINTDQPNLHSVLMARNGYSLILGTEDTFRATLTTSGNLLVGTTTDGGQKLQVLGNVLANTIRLQETATYSTAVVMNNRNANQQWGIAVDAAAVDDKFLAFIDQTNSLVALKLAALTGAATFGSSVTASSFIKSGGTSSQYLMADGSVTTGGGGGSVDELQVSLICQVFG